MPASDAGDRRYLLRPGDQPAVAALVAAALAVLAAIWWRHGGHRGGVVEIDRAAPLVARFQVDVNRADWPELIQLPGVGEVLAQRVVAERDQNGDFRNFDDLARVPGLGPRTLARIRPYVLPIPDDSNVATR